MDWVTVHLTQGAGATYRLPASDFAMVKVGEGNTPGSTWWIVAVANHMEIKGGSERRDISYLTDATLWNSVSGTVSSVPMSAHWGNIPWSGERLMRGLQAQKLALSCLP